MSYQDSFSSVSSQVSILNKNKNIHFFTGTPDPSISIFKPFCFNSSQQNEELKATTSPQTQDNDRRHDLYKVHETFYHTKIAGCSSLSVKKLKVVQAAIESRWMDCVSPINKEKTSKMDVKDENIFNTVVNEEIEFYKSLVDGKDAA
jgi:secernin